MGAHCDPVAGEEQLDVLPEHPPPLPEEAASTGSLFFIAHDNGSGDVYYENVETHEIVWDLPAEASVAQDGLVFNEHHTVDGDVYYSNTDTMETTWDLPEGARVVSVADDTSA